MPGLPMFLLLLTAREGCLSADPCFVPAVPMTSLPARLHLQRRCRSVPQRRSRESRRRQNRENCWHFIPGLTLGPHGANQIEPDRKLFPELPRPRMIRTPQLADESEIAEEWNPFPSGETPIRKPHEQVEGRRTGRK